MHLPKLRHNQHTHTSLGAGTSEFIVSTQKTKAQLKVNAQLKRSAQPVLSGIRVVWKYQEDRRIDQAPTQIVSLFSGASRFYHLFLHHHLLIVAFIILLLLLLF